MSSTGLAFKKIKTMKIAGLLDTLKGEDWKEHTLRQSFEGSCHRDTKAIFLRWSKKMDMESAFTDLDALDCPALSRHPKFKPVLKAIAAEVGGHLGRALLVYLKPGGRIEKHPDEGPYAENYDRFHLVLASDENVFFRVDHAPKNHFETVSMLPGELWWFDHRKPHQVDSYSPKGRVHLIVDVRTNKYRKGVN